MHLHELGDESALTRSAHSRDAGRDLSDPAIGRGDGDKLLVMFRVNKEDIEVAIVGMNV